MSFFLAISPNHKKKKTTILNLLAVQNSQQVRLDLKVTFGESFLVGKGMLCCLK